MFLIPRSRYIVKKTKEKGRGVFAARDLEAGTVIGDYLGIITDPKKEDEIKNGLYCMEGGTKYDILADPKKEGLHFINHSCANNCDMYPSQGHILFFALRKIFKGEELSINYRLGEADEKDITCDLHACHCGSALCTGTMHGSCKTDDVWDRLVRKNFGALYEKLPGKYGAPFPPLKKYPRAVTADIPALYNLFGSEKKPAEKYADTTLPAARELRKRIKETGRRLSFPRLKMTIYGIRDGMLLAKRTE